MDSGTWITIYTPVFILLFVIIPQETQAQAQKALMITRKRRQRVMEHELLKNYIGKTCKITTGSYGTTTSGKIIDIKDHWIELETRKGIELMNADFVQNIKILK